MNSDILPPQTERFEPDKSPHYSYPYAPVPQAYTNDANYPVFSVPTESLPPSDLMHLRHFPPIPDENSIPDPSRSSSTQLFDEPLDTRGSERLEKLTCSLNLLCYRSGSQGCVRRQIQVFAQKRYTALPTSASVAQEALAQDASLIRTDVEFFRALRKECKHNICGFWRLWLSIKTLRSIRLLSYTQEGRPEVVPLGDITLQEIFHAYQHPSSISDATRDDAWIDWVFRLRQEDRRHALEFVESWSGFRIALVGSVPWISATVVGIAWVAKGGDAQTAFTVAGFILTVGTSLLALLAIVSKIES